MIMRRCNVALSGMRTVRITTARVYDMSKAARALLDDSVLIYGYGGASLLRTVFGKVYGIDSRPFSIEQVCQSLAELGWTWERITYV